MSADHLSDEEQMYYDKRGDIFRAASNKRDSSYRKFILHFSLALGIGIFGALGSYLIKNNNPYADAGRAYRLVNVGSNFFRDYRDDLVKIVDKESVGAIGRLIQNIESQKSEFVESNELKNYKLINTGAYFLSLASVVYSVLGSFASLISFHKRDRRIAYEEDNRISALKKL